MTTLLEQHFGAEPPLRLGLAVSGGSDSRAMMEIAVPWAAHWGVALEVASVDHRLRPEAAAEAAGVATRAAELGLPVEVLRWESAPEGNVPAAARAARYRLLADWAQRRGLGGVALAHTQDDQAETFLLRLAREAGVDGLSGMAEQVTRHGVTFHRPLLAATRAELRAALVAAGQGWVDDPSNDDPRYARTQARAVLTALAPLGIDAATLAETAAQLRSAREALDGQVEVALAAHAQEDRGDVILSARLREEPEEIQRRLWIAALRWIGSRDYAPRRAALANLMLRAGPLRETLTLAGVLASPAEEGAVRLTREYAAVARASAPPDALWDNRWIVTGSFPPGAEVRALGHAGLAELGDWRATGLPRQSLLATPAIWQGEALLAAPVAAPERGGGARLAAHFTLAALSH
ncbi:tRNA lysidine(34) synthetase TilS [Pseudoroseicyclus sp. H15]